MRHNLLTGDPLHAKVQVLERGAEEVKDLIVEGDLMHHPENGGREYRGKVFQEGTDYIGVTEWGKKNKCGSHSKIVYQGPSVDDARNAVNTMIGKKLDKGYQPKRSGTDFLCYV